MPDLDATAVPGALARDPRLRVFLGEDGIETLRRYLVDEDLLSRSGGEYWRTGGTVLPSAEDGPAGVA